MVVKLLKDDGVIEIQVPYSMERVAFIKTLPNPRWLRDRGIWTVRATPYSASRLVARKEFVIDEATRQLANEWGGEPLRKARLRCKTKPWKHQREALEFADKKYAIMLAMDPGTGKSKVAIDLINTRRSKRILILCPKAVIPVWTEQFETHSTDQYQVIEAGGMSAKAIAENFKSGGDNVVLVINYESAWRGERAKWLLSRKWDVVVCDESHRIKSPGGRASRFCERLGRQAELRLCLTGTPFAHSLLDIYGQYRFLEPGIFGTNYARFRQMYAVTHPQYPSLVQSWHNQDDLHEKFYLIAYRCAADEVLDLPEYVHQRIPVKLPEATKKVYRELETELIAQVKERVVTVSNALSRLLRLQQITSGYLPVDHDQHRPGHGASPLQLNTAKEDALADLLKDLPAGEPVVVFARFTHDINAIHRAAEKSKRGSHELSGSKQELEQWKENGNVIAIQIQSGSEGISAVKARYCIFYSLGFSLAQYQQAQKRIHRPGQTRSVVFYHLVCPGTVDSQVYSALSKREKVIDSVLKEWED